MVIPPLNGQAKASKKLVAGRRRVVRQSQKGIVRLFLCQMTKVRKYGGFLMWMKHPFDPIWHFAESDKSSHLGCGLPLPPPDVRMVTEETLFQSFCYHCWLSSGRTAKGKIQPQQAPERTALSSVTSPVLPPNSSPPRPSKPSSRPEPHCANTTPSLPGLQQPMKPTQLWIRKKHEGCWHYVIDVTERRLACRTEYPDAESIVQAKKVKGVKRCRTCHSQSEQILIAWDIYKRRLQSLQQQKAKDLQRCTPFMATMKHLGYIGKCCQDAVRAKQHGDKGAVGGRVADSQADMDKWTSFCETTLQTYDKDPSFWSIVIERLSSPEQACTLTTMAEHVAVAQEAFMAYKREEIAEIQQAATELSVLLEKEPTLTFTQACLHSSLDTQHTLDKCVRQWRELIQYLTPEAYKTLLRQKLLEVISDDNRPCQLIGKGRASKKVSIEQQRTKAQADLQKHLERVAEDEARRERVARNSDSGVVGNPTHRRR